MILHNPVLIGQPLFKPQQAVCHISGSDKLATNYCSVLMQSNNFVSFNQPY